MVTYSIPLAVFLRTAMYKKTANGDRQAMLKVIQHGMMIAKYIDQVAQPPSMARDLLH